jgi:hypothetical protein
MAELMFGAHFAKQYVNDYLKIDIPKRLIAYRNGWNLDDYKLPNPEEYLTYEPLALDRWPSIITVAISGKSFNRLGYDSNNPLYHVTYGMRTYVWVRTEGSEDVTLMRDRLTTVVRSALMDKPCLELDENLRDAYIDEASMSEEYSDLTLLKGDRVLAGAYIAYDLRLEEVIARENIATLSNVDTEVMTIGQLQG